MGSVLYPNWPTKAGSFSQRMMLHFKSGWRIHKQAWTECFLAELKKMPIRKGAVVLRALHGDELSVSGTPGNSLDELGPHIEDEFRCRYHPGLLRKNRTTQKAKFLSTAGREAEFLGAYMFNPSTEAAVSEIIVLDDILTTGTTMKAIIQAIRSVLTNLVEIKLFTLANTDQRAVLNKSVLLKSYSYEWVSHKGWITASEEVAEYHSLLTLLKQKILNDAFVDEDNRGWRDLGQPV